MGILSLVIRSAGEHRLDVDDRRAVDGLDGAYAQACSLNFAHGDAVETKWVGAVRRAGSKHASQPPLRIGARMDLQYVSASLVQPGDHQDVVSGSIPSSASVAKACTSSDASGAPLSVG